jgi:plastocyanin
MLIDVGRRLKKHWRKPAALAAVAIAAAVAVGGATGNAAQDRTVRTQGDNQFVPNVKIASTLKFTPGHITIGSGEALTLEHSDSTEEPHTLSIVDADEVPANIDEVFGCGEPGTVCDDIFSIFGAEPTESLFQNAPGTGDGIDGRLDSLFVLPGESVSADVTAEPGSTLYYICAIHAWMQGRIDVK